MLPVFGRSRLARAARSLRSNRSAPRRPTGRGPIGSPPSIQAVPGAGLVRPGLLAGCRRGRLLAGDRRDRLDRDGDRSSLDRRRGGTGRRPAARRGWPRLRRSHPPSPAEALQRDPQAGAFSLAGGQIGFAAVDGRTPDVSVGLTRPEFAALFLSLGASDAIGFDSGGSATLVARTPGDAVATVQNAPSDGVERPVADAFLVFSDLPAGPPARLAVRPSPAVILSGAAIAPYAVVTDAAGHPLQSVAEARAAVPTMRLSVDPASVARPAADGRLVGAEPGSAILLVGERGLSERVPLQVVSTLARLRLEPARANPDPGGVVQYRAEGFDAPGTPVELGTMVTWRASNGSVDGDGRLHVGASDATIVAEARGRRAEAVVRVGRRRLPIDVFGPRVVWKYSTYPAGGQGAVVTASDARPSELDLQYDFGAGVWAAYAGARIDLGGEPLGFSVDVRGDGSGAGVRAAFLNSRGERVLVTVAKRIAWTGWQRCDVQPATQRRTTASAGVAVCGLVTRRSTRAWRGHRRLSGPSHRFRREFCTGPTFHNVPLKETGRGNSVTYESSAWRALDTAKSRGAGYADIRFEAARSERIEVRNGAIAELEDDMTTGYGIRAFVDGAWGFAANHDLDTAAIDRTAARAVEIAKAGAAVAQRRFAEAPSDSAVDTYVTPVERDPDAVSLGDRVALLFAAERELHVDPRIAAGRLGSICGAPRKSSSPRSDRRSRRR